MYTCSQISGSERIQVGSVSFFPVAAYLNSKWKSSTLVPSLNLPFYPSLTSSSIGFDLVEMKKEKKKGFSNPIRLGLKIL